MMHDAPGTGPLHGAARLEARVSAVVARALQRRGWRPAVSPHVGYGADGWVRVLARVLLVPPGSSRVGVRDARGWRRFVTTEAPGVPVTVRVGSHLHHAISDREGYLDLRLPSDLEPGWSRVTFTLEDAEPVEAPVHVVGPETRTGLVSDIDDTVIETMLPRPLVAFRNAFFARESTRRAVPGMSELYAQITAAHPDLFVVYLSTGAWNLAVPLNAFLARHGFPQGPLLLTDWGPTESGWFRSGQDHKRTELRRLVDDLPGLRWLLVGDDGQHDPLLYAEAVAAAPDRVLGVAIRQLSLTQQVVIHGNATAPDRPTVGDGSGAAAPVLAPDGYGLADGLRARGIVLDRRPI
ncbi:MAG: phosphatase domain-containing protein [Nocardioides sp.]